MSRTFLAAVFLVSGTCAFAEPMIEMKGLTSPTGCLEATKVVTERLKTCPVAKSTIRIWCPNGKVFDRDEMGAGIALLRSICEMNQLPG
jgi:hypothetical protein